VPTRGVPSGGCYGAPEASPAVQRRMQPGGGEPVAMAPTLTSPMAPSLKLVETPALAARECTPVVPVGLASAPFRPGELPEVHWVSLDAPARAATSSGCTNSRLPPALWIRIAVEAARVNAELTSLTQETQAALSERLDRAANDDGAVTSDVLPTSLSRYARALTSGPRGTMPDGDIALRLPVSMYGTWRNASIEAQETLDTWARRMIGAAPARCVAWEIAAASKHLTIAEWAYAAILRTSASSIA
jgi:hypothetical protein